MCACAYQPCLPRLPLCHVCHSADHAWRQGRCARCAIRPERRVGRGGVLLDAVESYWTLWSRTFAATPKQKANPLPRASSVSPAAFQVCRCLMCVMLVLMPTIPHNMCTGCCRVHASLTSACRVHASLTTCLPGTCWWTSSKRAVQQCTHGCAAHTRGCLGGEDKRQVWHCR